MNVPNQSKKNVAIPAPIIATENSERLKTRGELAAELNICTKTMLKFMRMADLKLPKGLIQVPHQQLIRAIVLGVPNYSQQFLIIPKCEVVEAVRTL
jgi:hypothetical protein